MNDRQDRLRQEIWKRLAGQQIVFLATADGDQPRLRPITLMRLQSRLFFATGSGSAKVKQMMQNPNTEFCLMFGKKGNRGIIRAECTATVVNEKDIKAEAYNNAPHLSEFWKSPEDSGYALIELRPTGFEYYRPGSVEAMKVKP